MSPEEAVAVRLLDISAVTARVSTRVYLDTLPQGPEYPLVLVQLVHEPSDYHLRGGLRDRGRVQVDAYWQDESGVDAAGEVLALAEAINGDDAGSGLSGWRGDVGSPALTITGIRRIIRVREYEPDKRLRRQRQDFWVHFRMN